MWVSLDFISEGAEERFHTKLLINKNISFARLPDSGLLRFSLLFSSHFSPATLLFPLVTAFRISFTPSSLCTPKLPQQLRLYPTHTATNTRPQYRSHPLFSTPVKAGLTRQVAAVQSIYINQAGQVFIYCTCKSFNCTIWLWRVGFRHSHNVWSVTQANQCHLKARYDRSRQIPHQTVVSLRVCWPVWPLADRLSASIVSQSSVPSITPFDRT